MSKKRWDMPDETPEVTPDPLPLSEEPTPPAPGKKEVAPPPAAPVGPVEPSALMTLRVFATLAGPKWDQMAGFVSWAQVKKLQPMTMGQWRVEFESFKSRPVG